MDPSEKDGFLLGENIILKEILFSGAKDGWYKTFEHDRVILRRIVLGNQ